VLAPKAAIGTMQAKLVLAGLLPAAVLAVISSPCLTLYLRPRANVGFGRYTVAARLPLIDA
jgi:hypothetical protein